MKLEIRLSSHLPHQTQENFHKKNKLSHLCFADDLMIFSKGDVNSIRMIRTDVHHGNYNPSCKAKTNVQEDSDGPMTRARAKQLQRALTSQMIEAASELKISNQSSCFVRKLRKISRTCMRLSIQILMFCPDHENSPRRS